MIQDIVNFETDDANGDAVVRRKRMFHYMDALKNDEYFKSYVVM
jgi:predicted oxidoreductase